MTLEAMAEEYRHSALLCRKRMKELRHELRNRDMTQTERLKLLRRICVLESMARQASSTGRYLANYYKEDKAHGSEGPSARIINFPCGGISSPEAVCEAV